MDNRQINLYDFLEEKDWIDKYYFVWKCYHNGNWTEYSPKHLTKEEAKEWMMEFGEQLVYKFGRTLKLFNVRPTDHKETFYVEFEDEDGNVETKVVPGEDFYDACDNLRLFNPEIYKINVGYNGNLNI